MASFIGTLLGIGIFIFIGLVFIAMIKFAFSSNDKYSSTYESDLFVEKSNQKFKNIRSDIDKINQNLIRELSQQTDPVFIMLIQSVIDNLKYVKLRECQIKVVREWNANSKAYWNANGFISRLKNTINNRGTIVRHDYRSLIDNKTENLYSKLSKAYSQLHLVVSEQIDTAGFNVDITNSKFFYVTVGDIKIPRFKINGNENKILYIYPTVCVECNDMEAFTAYSIEDLEITYTEIVQEGKSTVIMNMEKIETHFFIDNIDIARDFCDAFNELKSHVKEVEESNELNATSIAKKETEINNSLSCLDDYIGLNYVKKEFFNIANFIRVQLLRKAQGLKTIPISYHYVFTGNPGTGKTTMARVLADLYKELGVLKKGQLIETDRAGLVAEYIGQTAIKTNEKIDQALGGVLFIDEAYSLVKGGNEDFGHEAITTLLKRMEDSRDNLVVVLAGYPDEMKEFIDSNPGLQSRFNRYINFEDYTPEELFRIFQHSCSQHEYKLTEEAKKQLEELFKQAYAKRDKNFGNGRFVRNLFEKTCQNQADRIVKIENPSREQMIIIDTDDIPDINKDL